MHFWGPNKRTKEVTVQVDKSRNGEARHVELFTFEVVKPLLDKLLAGILPKNLAKTFFS